MIINEIFLLKNRNNQVTRDFNLKQTWIKISFNFAHWLEKKGRKKIQLNLLCLKNMRLLRHVIYGKAMKTFFQPAAVVWPDFGWNENIINFFLFSSITLSYKDVRGKNVIIKSFWQTSIEKVFHHTFVAYFTFYISYVRNCCLL